MVSVIIPTYNREAILHRAVESVIKQTYTDWELLIVDDGSKDDTKKVIRNNYLYDSRIQFLERPDSRQKGANACRNVGIEQARGKYIAFLDSDDEWRENHLENCFHFAESQPSFTGAYTSTHIKKGPFEIKTPSRCIDDGETFIDFLLGDGSAMTPTLFVKTDLAKKIKFDEFLQRHQDWDFFIRFGKEFQWNFNPSSEVIVHRSLKKESERIDFDSCITFYHKHKDEITKEVLKKKYLSRMYDKSVLMDAKKGMTFYENELRKIEKGKKYTISKVIRKKLMFKLQQTYFFGFFKYLLKKYFSEVRS